MEELRDVLSSSQIALLSKTLQLQSSAHVRRRGVGSNVNDDPDTTAGYELTNNREEITTDAHLNKINKIGLLPGFSFDSAFSASFTSVDQDLDFLKKIYDTHDVYSGLGSDLLTDGFYKILTEEETDEIDINVLILGNKLREIKWNKEATKIQASWRGMKTRQRVLAQLEQAGELN